MQSQQRSYTERLTMKSMTTSTQGQDGARPSVVKLILIILLDATGSMEGAINALVDSIHSFLDTLMSAQLSPDLGLVIFRDELIGEMPKVYGLGTPVEELKRVLSVTKAEGGGDIPESSLAALRLGISLMQSADPTARKAVLHITDAPPHDPENGVTSQSVLKELAQQRVVYFGCAPQIAPYTDFAQVTGGTIFPLRPNIEVDAFKSILDSVARRTVKTIKGMDGGLSEEDRDLLRKRLKGE